MYIKKIVCTSGENPNMIHFVIWKKTSITIMSQGAYSLIKQNKPHVLQEYYTNHGYL